MTDGVPQTLTVSDMRDLIFAMLDSLETPICIVMSGKTVSCWW